MYTKIIWLAAITAVIWISLLLLDRIYDLESRGVSVSPGYAVWRTQHGLGLLDRISNAARRFWNIFGKVGAGAGIIVMGGIFFLIVLNLFVLTAQGVPSAMEGQPGVVPILPGVTIPLIAGLIGIAVVLLTHEPAHGIIARNLDIDIESTGLALFLIIPGAFVEENEEDFENSRPWDRIQMAAAGPFANILMAIGCLILILALINPLPGIFVFDTEVEKPAYEAGLPPKSRIVKMNETEINTISDFRGFLDNASPGQRVTLYTAKDGQYPVTLANENGEAYVGVKILPVTSVSKLRLIGPLGIYSVAFSEVFSSLRGTLPLINDYTYESIIPWPLLRILKWIFTLSLLVGIFNLLPLKPLDGGHIVEGISEKFTSKPTAETITNVISVVTVSVILIAAVIPLL